MKTIEELLAELPDPPDLALDLTNNVITPPEDYDYPEKWDDVMHKWTEFAQRIAAWQAYLQGVAGIAVDARDNAVNAAISVNLPVITPADYGKALRAGRESDNGQYTFQEYGEVEELRREILIGLWD